MAVEIFGGRMHDDVGAERQRPRQHGRGDRRVDAEEGAGAVGDGRDGGDVADGPRRIGGRLQPDHARLARLNGGLDRLGAGRIDEGGIDAERASVVGEPFLQGPVHDIRRDDVRRALQRKESRRGGRHAGAEHETGGGAFQFLQDAFGLTDVRRVGTAVDEAAAILVVGIADVGGGRLDRRNDGAGRLIDETAGLGCNGFGTHRLGHGRPRLECVGLLARR